MALSIEVKTASGGVTHVLPVGEIDLGTAPALREAVTTALRDARPDTVIIDLDGVMFLDSTGIAALISCRRLADALTTTCHVINIRDGVRWVLEIAGVLPYLSGEMTPTA